MSLTSEHEFSCPYCGSPNGIVLDTGQGKRFTLVTDCEICCRPIVVHIQAQEDEYILDARAENE